MKKLEKPRRKNKKITTKFQKVLKKLNLEEPLIEMDYSEIVSSHQN